MNISSNMIANILTLLHYCGQWRRELKKLNNDSDLGSQICVP